MLQILILSYFCFSTEIQNVYLESEEKHFGYEGLYIAFSSAAFWLILAFFVFKMVWCQNTKEDEVPIIEK